MNECARRRRTSATFGIAWLADCRIICSGTIDCITPTIDSAICSELIQVFSARLGELERTVLIANHDSDVRHGTSIVRSLLERRIGTEAADRLCASTYEGGGNAIEDIVIDSELILRGSISVSCRATNT